MAPQINDTTVTATDFRADGGSDFDLKRPAPDRVRLATVDNKRRMAPLSRPSPENIGGRGLVLVDALSNPVRRRSSPLGKRV
ncbi:ATP-binding protein [Streptomyces avermitilis]|uniref:hypothetical protein n=1 Tax=Streptomyces avermitilis TaxID=33903 RepID=UPI003721FB93